MNDIVQGFLLLGLAQIPLSLGNSLLAAHQVAEDLYPEKKITLKKIGTTYSLMNLIVPFFSGIPVCHGSGGLVGVHAFGGRTGGSVAIYGLFFITLGACFGKGATQVISIFPMPVLGVLLFVEGLALIAMMQDIAENKHDFSIAILVGLISFGLPYGFLIGIILGSLLYKFMPNLSLTK